MAVKYVSDFEFPASAGFKVQKYAKGGMVADESRYESKGPKTRYTAAKGRREMAERKMRHAEKYAPGLSLDMADKPSGKMSKFAAGGVSYADRVAQLRGEFDTKRAETRKQRDAAKAPSEKVQAMRAASDARIAARRQASDAAYAARQAARKGALGRGAPISSPQGSLPGNMPDRQAFASGGISQKYQAASKRIMDRRAAAKPPVSKGPTRNLRPAPDLSYMPVPDGGRSGGMSSNDMQMFSKGGKMVKGRKGGGKC
jgi:hypothetical protein